MPAGMGYGPEAIAATVAQLSAMPPKQSLALIQMEMAKAQQGGSPEVAAFWQQVGQLVQAGMQQQAGAAMPQGAPQQQAPAQGNIVSQVLGGGM